MGHIATVRKMVEPSNEELWGSDNNGRRVTRKVYVDESGFQYVSLGRYGMSNPKALVPLSFFVDHIMSFSYLVERN